MPFERKGIQIYFEKRLVKTLEAKDKADAEAKAKAEAEAAAKKAKAAK